VISTALRAVEIIPETPRALSGIQSNSRAQRGCYFFRSTTGAIRGAGLPVSRCARWKSSRKRRER